MRVQRLRILSLLLLLVLLTGCGGKKLSDEPIVGEMNKDNTILLNGRLPEGLYTLRYVGEDGPLEDYAEICTLNHFDALRVQKYEYFIEANCAPLEAEMIGVYNEAGKRVGVIPFAASFDRDPGEKLYSFGAISDIHIGYETAEEDFKNAFTFFGQDESIAFVGISGDLTSSATDNQLKKYREIVRTHAQVPVYAITGNHDTAKYRGSSVSAIIDQYTGQPLSYTFTHGEDVFIMLGMEAEETGHQLADGALQWLYETLETNRDKRIFLFTHAYTNNSSGDPENIYGFDLWVGDEETIFLSLLKHYKNVTLFHGHSHVEFALQSLGNTAIVELESGYNSIHIPSLAAPRTGTVETEGSIMTNYLYEKSEGYVVEVYENAILLKGRDFVQGKFLPIAQYYIPTPVTKIAAGGYADATKTVNTTAFLEQQYEKYALTYTIGELQATNTAKILYAGQQFETELISPWGTALDSVTVTMAGEDISETAVDGNKITVPEVSGEIVITATTKYATSNVVDLAGYVNNRRLSWTNGGVKEQKGYTVTGHIELEPGAVYRTQGVDYRYAEQSGYCMLWLYDGEKKANVAVMFNDKTQFPTYLPSKENAAVSINCDGRGNLVITVAEDLLENTELASCRFMRLSGYGAGGDLLITKNQRIPTENKE